MGEHEFKREYLGIPGGAEASPFSWDLYERATRIPRRWCRRARPLRRPLNNPCLVPTRSAIFR